MELHGQFLFTLYRVDPRLKKECTNKSARNFNISRTRAEQVEWAQSRKAGVSNSLRVNGKQPGLFTVRITAGGNWS